MIDMTDHRPLVALAPVIGLAADCVSHVIAARIIRGRNPYPALAVGASRSSGSTSSPRSPSPSATSTS